MRVLPTRVHAVLDYSVGVLLIAAPWIFRFADESSVATWISVVVGVAMIGLSAMTDYEGGFLSRTVPMRAHLATDAIVGLFLLVSPWLFGFADNGPNAWLPFVLIGIGELGAAALTDPTPHDRGIRHRVHAA